MWGWARAQGGGDGRAPIPKDDPERSGEDERNVQRCEFSRPEEGTGPEPSAPPPTSKAEPVAPPIAGDQLVAGGAVAPAEAVAPPADPVEHPASIDPGLVVRALGRSAAGKPRLELAVKLRKQLADSGLTVRLSRDGAGVVAELQPGRTEDDIDPAQRELLDQLRPELVAILTPKPAPADASAAPRGKPATVPQRQWIRSRIELAAGGRLDAPGRAEAAGVMAGPAGFNDGDRETSARTYQGILDDLAAGRTSEDVTHAILEAFDETGNGRDFIGALKRKARDWWNNRPARLK